MAKSTKTMTEHLETGAKYSGSSIALASALTVLVVYFFPEMKEDPEVPLALQAILAFTLNLALIRFFKG